MFTDDSELDEVVLCLVGLVVHAAAVGARVPVHHGPDLQPRRGLGQRQQPRPLQQPSHPDKGGCLVEVLNLNIIDTFKQ